MLMLQERSAQCQSVFRARVRYIELSEPKNTQGTPEMCNEPLPPNPVLTP